VRSKGEDFFGCAREGEDFFWPRPRKDKNMDEDFNHLSREEEFFGRCAPTPVLIFSATTRFDFWCQWS
jgi:hypothetical protein